MSSRISLAERGSAISPQAAVRLADAMFALSTPSRVQILGCLLVGPATVSELVEALAMEQSSVSHQLRVLREHELVRASRSGRQRIYRLYDDDVAALLQYAMRHVDRRGQRAGGLRRRASSPSA